VAAVTAALEAAAAAGIQSLEPGRNNGAVLAASFEHILQQARYGAGQRSMPAAMSSHY
jgi:hypothetical protein